MLHRVLIVALALIALVGCHSETLDPDAMPSPTDASRDMVDAAVHDATADAVADRLVMDAAPDAPLVRPACPEFGDAIIVGTTSATELTEISGVVASRSNPGVLWVHNDSGGQPRVFALDEAGAIRATYRLDGAAASDWEDIAIGPGPTAGVDYLYVGDIGNNGARRQFVRVYRFEEPSVQSDQRPVTTNVSAFETFELSYPDRPVNAESLMIDPENGDLYIVRKRFSGDPQPSEVFVAPAPIDSSSRIEVQEITRIPFNAFGDVPTTAGGMSADGREILIKTNQTAYLWRKLPGESVLDALASEPCPVNLAGHAVFGEAIGFAPDGSGFYRINEGRNRPLVFHPRQ